MTEASTDRLDRAIAVAAEAASVENLCGEHWTPAFLQAAVADLLEGLDFKQIGAEAARLFREYEKHRGPVRIAAFVDQD